MQLNYSDLFPELPVDARVWIYTSNRKFSSYETTLIEELMAQFVKNWATHGSSMTAHVTILHDIFLVIAADERKLAASGCSIDASVRFIKEIGNNLNIDFFDRLKVYITDLQNIERVSYQELGSFSGWYYFDPLIFRLSDMRSNWPVKLV